MKAKPSVKTAATTSEPKAKPAKKQADAAPKATRAVKPKAATKPAATKARKGEIILVAQVDVGHGNTLYFRGWGGGLRWDGGVPAVCEGENRWVLKLTGVTEPVHFKALLNDNLWSTGPDLTAQPSGLLEFAPEFGV